MNYFPFDPDPYISANYLDDKRVARIFAEGVMTLSVAYRKAGYQGPLPYADNLPVPPKLIAWINADDRHTLWFRAWLCALHQVMEERFGSKVNDYVSVKKFFNSPFGTPVFCPPSDIVFVNLARSVEKGLDFTGVPDVHQAYKDYLRYQIAHIDKRKAVWS